MLDLFGGSGPKLIACEQSGRRAYLMEVDALYPSTSLRTVSPSNRCDVIVQRWEEFTGRKAERVEEVQA